MMTHFYRNQHGIQLGWQWVYPLWLKQFLMKRAGKCAKPHSEWKGYYCDQPAKHDGYCGCV